jgi:hypothetical protein
MTNWMADVVVNWINRSFVHYLLIVHASDQNFFFDLGFKASDLQVRNIIIIIIIIYFFFFWEGGGISYEGGPI